MSVIAQDIGKPPVTVYSYLLYHGGIEPRETNRRRDCLSPDDRETISRGLASGMSIRHISRELNRSPSTISREVLRNGGRHKYRACAAEKAFIKRCKRPKPFLLAEDTELKDTVTGMLGLDWSPEQISGWLRNQSAARSRGQGYSGPLGRRSNRRL